MPPSAPAPEPSPGGVSGLTLLQLMWLASPALPVGGFSYSEGLEAAVEAGRVSDEATARDWLCDQLRLGLARSELPVLAQALHAWRGGDLARVETLNAWVAQTRETSELRQQAEQMGRSLFEWLRHGPQSDDARLQQLRALAPRAHLAGGLRAGRRPSRRRSPAKSCWPTPSAGPRTRPRLHSRPCPWARSRARASCAR